MKVNRLEINMRNKIAILQGSINQCRLLMKGETNYETTEKIKEDRQTSVIESD